MARPSHVRNAVRMRMAGDPRHGWSVDELKAELDASDISADYSSVFRALVWLETRGFVQSVDLGDGKTRFESRREHHEHVQCERCGSVSEVPGCLVERSASEIEAETGYRLTTHRLVLTGVCPTCAAA
ncbi:MAG: transcriptional repressor [Chloroflexi bacterium]|nr:MAG: transcriptional repressor [Chloroflexota bacterium]